MNRYLVAVNIPDDVDVTNAADWISYMFYKEYQEMEGPLRDADVTVWSIEGFAADLADSPVEGNTNNDPALARLRAMGWGGPGGSATTTPEGVVFRPWSSGGAVGFEVSHPDQRVEYVYLNPSTDDSDGLANAFVYTGEGGDPAIDTPHHYYGLFYDEPESA